MNAVEELRNSVHPRALNNGKLDEPGGVLPTELGGLHFYDVYTSQTMYSDNIFIYA